jgi:acyl-CoA thioester hydrolase
VIRPLTAAEAAHELPIRIYFEDTDAGGIVYHAHYLRYAERARTEWMRTLGYDHRRLAAEHGLLFAVVRSELDFVTPARLDDKLVVRTRLERFGGIRLELEQQVCCDDRLVCRVLITLVLIDQASLRPKRLPEALRQRFADALSGAGVAA